MESVKICDQKESLKGIKTCMLLYVLYGFKQLLQTIKSVKICGICGICGQKECLRHQNLNALYVPPILDHIMLFKTNLQSLKKLFFNL